MLRVLEMTARGRSALALGLSQKRVGEVLRELQTSGLASEHLQKWTTGVPNLHLPKESSHLRSFHRNYRDFAYTPGHYHSPQNIHYSASFGLDVETLARLREETLLFLERTREMIAPTPNRVVGVMGIDLVSICPE